MYVTHEFIWCFVSERMLQTKMCNVETYATYGNMMTCVRTYVTYENVMSENTLHTNTSCDLSELMLHTKMCNVRTYVTHEYEMCAFRTYVTYENMVSCVQTYIIYEYDIFSVWTYGTYQKFYVRTNFTHENMMFWSKWCYIRQCYMPELCYTRKDDVVCPNLCYIR